MFTAQPCYPTIPAMQQMASSQADLDLVSSFRAVDLDGTGFINVNELQLALSSTGVPFSIVTTERLLSMFDKNFDRLIDFNEFKELHAYVLSMQEGFRQRDLNSDGLLGGAEVRAALALAKYYLDESTFQALMHRFDRQKRGGLLFDDYIEISIFIARAAQVFAKNDPLKTGAALLTFNKFLEASLEVI